MKNYILILSVATIAACSSTPKEATTQMDKKAADVKSAAKSAETSAKKEVAKETEKVKKAVEAAAPVTADGSASLVSCTYNGVKRELKINQSAEKCTVEYIKDGNSQEIATGAPKSPFCGEIMDRVKNNLTTAGYKCE